MRFPSNYSERECASQSTQFPEQKVTSDLDEFGFPVLVPILGARYVRPQAESKAHSLPIEPHSSGALANVFCEVQLPIVDRQPRRSFPALLQHAAQLESTHLSEPLGIESQALDLSES